MIIQMAQPQIVGQLLQLAVAAAHAVGTVAVVLREDQLHVGAPGLPDPRGIGVDHHAVPDVVVAGGHQLVDAFNLHQADAAGGDFVELLQIAQAGNGDANAPGGAENGGVPGNGNGYAVDCAIDHLYHFFVLPPLNTPKPK